MPEACRHLYLKVVCLHAGCTPTYDGNLLHRHGRLIANFRNSEYHAEYLTGKLELARIGFYHLIFMAPDHKTLAPGEQAGESKLHQHIGAFLPQFLCAQLSAP